MIGTPWLRRVKVIISPLGQPPGVTLDHEADRSSQTVAAFIASCWLSKKPCQAPQCWPLESTEHLPHGCRLRPWFASWIRGAGQIGLFPWELLNRINPLCPARVWIIAELISPRDKLHFFSTSCNSPKSPSNFNRLSGKNGLIQNDVFLFLPLPASLLSEPGPVFPWLS